MIPLKIITLGKATAVVLPQEAMARLSVREGDTLYLTEVPDGGYRLTPRDPVFIRQTKQVEEITHHDQKILRTLPE